MAIDDLSPKVEPARPRAPGKSTSAKRDRKPPAQRYRKYYGPEKMRAAYRAGQGWNAGEIAQEMGGTTPRKVRDMLRDCGIRLARPFGRPKAVQIHCTNLDLRRLEDEAAVREVEPADLALHMLRILLEEPTLLRNLLDEAESDGAVTQIRETESRS